jgi:hypothetical protein
MGETPQPRPIQSTKDGAFWQTQIKQALQVREPHEPWWEANLKAYAPRVTDSPKAFGDEINTNRDFTLVERKKADLFYQRPDVTLQPTPMMDQPILKDGQAYTMPGAPPPAPGQPAPSVPQTVALAAHEQIVNEKLGPDGIDATALMDAVLFDVELFGLAATKMGYESVTAPAPHPTDPLAPPIDVPIDERVFWEDLSLKQLLIPASFRRSGQYDKAPWLGERFEVPLTEGTRQKFKLPPDFKGSSSDSKQFFDHGTDAPQSEMVVGTEIWYKSSLYRSDVLHPDHLTQLVLIDGISEPTIEQDCPYQTLRDDGSLTPDSLIGFPIHLFTLRVIRDSAYPPADCTLIRPLVNELNLFRGQMVQYRDAQTLKWAYRVSALPPEVMNKIVRSPVGGMIGMPDEAFPLEQNLVELPHGSMPRESFQSNDYIDNDIARTTAIDASGAGVQSTGSQTATQTQVIAANANARLDKERGLALKLYCKGVTKFSTLILRTLPVAQATAIVGPSLAQVWDTWRAGGVDSALAFTALPDSALRTDQAVDRKQSQDLYSFLANDPYIQKGRGQLLEKLLRKFHIDPTGIVNPPDPAKPDPPKVTVSFNGADLIGPQAPMVIEILQQQGIQITAQAVEAASTMLAQVQQQALLQGQQQALQEQQANQPPDTTHGGLLAQQASLSKHAAEMTGGIQGTGTTAPMGATGGHLQ